MPLSTPVKVVLVGCVVVVVGIMVVFGAGGYFVQRWWHNTAHKIENITGGGESDYGKKAAELQKEYPFQPPSNGVITEDQLNRFLAVRKGIHTIFEQNKTEIEALGKQDKGFQASVKGVEMINNLRMTQIHALEQQHMSKEEYDYILTTVYSTWFTQAARVGLQYADQARDALQKQIDQIDQQLNDPSATEESRKQLQERRSVVVQQRDDLTKNEEVKKAENEMNSLPKENVELFKKHEKEIAQYSMGGLEFIGL
jgi:hypothetical protein